jgi:hypothetical protein
VPGAPAHRLRRSRLRGRDLALGFALLLLACGLLACGAGPWGSREAVALGWTSGASAFVFDPPDDDAFVSPIVDADRGALHLEARYNYEDLQTGSLFIGRTLEFGKGVAGTIVPLLGLVLGRTDAVAPGVNLDLAWRGIAFSTESEVIIDLHDPNHIFLYSWLETTFAVAGGLRLGVVGQHTKTYETGLDLQRGPMIELSRGRGWLGFYWFNLDRPDDQAFVFGGGWAF